VSQAGETKDFILESCISPKTWKELVKITRKSDPTLAVHLRELRRDELLQKQDDMYVTTDKGVSKLKSTGSRIARYVLPANLMLQGIIKDRSFKDRIYRMFPELGARGLLGKSTKAYYDAIAEAVVSSVNILLPKTAEVDEKLFLKINEVIGEMMKKEAFVEKGKFSLTVSVDFPAELDLRIRKETDPAIREQLIENRQMIIDQTMKSWSTLFNSKGLLA
jgi:hypothetical protein